MNWKAFAALTALLLAANATCLLFDQSPLLGDATDYLVQSQTWAGFFAGRVSFADCYFEPDLKPELWTALGGAVLHHAQPRRHALDVLLATQQLCLSVLLLAVFSATAQATGANPPNAPLLAAAIVGLSPIVFGMSRRYMPDVPLAAAVWSAIALLLASRGYRRPWFAAAFGLVCGLGMLMRPTFALFLAGPAALAAIEGIRRSKDRPRAARGIGLSALGLFVALPWYWVKFGPSLERYRQTHPENLLAPWSGPGISGGYLAMLWNEQMGWLFASLAAAGVLRLLAVRELRGRYGRVMAAGAASVAIPLLVFGSMAQQLARYTLALTPFFAVALALGLLAETTAQPSAISRRARRAIVAATLTLGVAQFAYLSFADATTLSKWPALGRALALPHTPWGHIDTHVGLFGIERRPPAPPEICTALDALRARPARVLIVGDLPCRASDALHRAKERLAFRELTVLAVNWPLADRAAIDAWPDLLLLAFADETALRAAERSLALNEAPLAVASLHAPGGDLWMSAHRRDNAPPGQPPPSLAHPVELGNCE